MEQRISKNQKQLVCLMDRATDYAKDNGFSDIAVVFYDRVTGTLNGTGTFTDFADMERIAGVLESYAKQIRDQAQAARGSLQ